MEEQTLGGFEIGDRVKWTYSYQNGWRFRDLTGTVIGFTKHRIRVKFDEGQYFERKTLPPSRLKRATTA